MISNILLTLALGLILKLIYLTFLKNKDFSSFLGKKQTISHAVAKSQNQLIKELMPHLQMRMFFKNSYSQEELKNNEVYQEVEAKIQILLSEAGFKTLNEFRATLPKPWNKDNINP